MRRQETLTNGRIYHVFNKSIAGYRIFSYSVMMNRFKGLIKYYEAERNGMPFSYFTRWVDPDGDRFWEKLPDNQERTGKKIEIIAYCLMPTHFHLVLRQLRRQGISKSLGCVLNGFSHFFNLKNDRKGPLWSGPFRSVPVDSDEQLLHLTRYVHLNPVSAGLVSKPEDWLESSYREYIGYSGNSVRLCNFANVIQITGSRYRAFVNDGADYQKQLQKIKPHVLY